MEIVFTTGVVTNTANYQRGDRAHWPDEADAKRLIKAGYAKPAPAEKGRG